MLEATGVELNCTQKEMKVFFGMLMYMGIFKLSIVRMHWQAGTRIPAIADTMAVNRLFRLRSALHRTDQNAFREEPRVDKFWKVRPLLDAIRVQYLDLEELENSSIDEQMVPFTRRVHAKQVIKSKLNPVGGQNLSGAAVMVLHTTSKFTKEKARELTASTSTLDVRVVMRLVETFPDHQNLKLFFDNYFISILLLRELKTKGILAMGTIRSNHLLGCNLKNDQVLIMWKDNNLVPMASTRVGVARSES